MRQSIQIEIYVFVFLFWKEEEQGNVSYDAWGNLRNPQTHALYTESNMPTLFLERGFTGHEHMPEFGLINMNARLYDPALGRFLSADPYIQLPDFSQSYNRYTYCLNNPLRYADITGEWFGIDDLLIAGVSFVAGYVSHGVSTGHWGMSAVKTGVISAGMGWLGYNTAGMATGSITAATWQHAIGIGANALVNNLFPPMTVPVNSHFGLTFSPSFGFGTDGITAGIFGSAYYTSKDFDLSLGIGLSNTYYGWNANASSHGWGGGFGQTYYDAVGNLGAQKVGTYSVQLGHSVSFRISNDLWGDGFDRWRTSAAELSIGNFSLGTYVTTNWGSEESGDKTNMNGRDILLGSNLHDLGAWEKGEVYFAPLWIGYSNKYISYKFGYSHKYVQSLTQNFVHKYISPTSFFNRYDFFRAGGYFSIGRSNPLSLW